MSGRGVSTAERSSVRGGIIGAIPAVHVYICCGYTDMRKSIDGLAAMVQQSLKQNAAGNNLYLFCGRRSDRIKALYYEGDGFILLYKRLESGRFQWPRHEAEARRITCRQLMWLMEGLCIEQPQAISQASPKYVV
jgi:transposase